MKDIDAAYISALIDYIGCIKIEPPKKSDVCCLYVWITNEDFKLMEYLQRFGASVIQLDDRRFRARWKDQRAYDLLKSIERFSKKKKEQIRIGVEFLTSKKNTDSNENLDITFRLRLKMEKKAEG